MIRKDSFRLGKPDFEEIQKQEKLEKNLTPAQLQVRKQTLKGMKPITLFMSCSGVMIAQPNTPEEWQDAREYGDIWVDKAFVPRPRAR
jgi:hypothetical protein